MRFIAPFTEELRSELRKHIMMPKLLTREKKRFSAIMFSSEQRMKIPELSKLFEVSHNTIKSWFDKYELSGFSSLLDGNMSHKKSSLSNISTELIFSTVANNPQNMKAVVATLEVTHKVKTKPAILKRYLKGKKYSWRRLRKSLKSQQKEGDFDLCQASIEALKVQEDKGEINLWFSDESGFNLNPASVYAWLAPNSALCLPAEKVKCSSVLGFVKRNNESQFYTSESNMCSELWIKIVDNFVEELTAKNALLETILRNVIVIDNASFHKSKIVQDKIAFWEKNHVFIHYLKPYCSELNPIEIVWRFMKHKWLSFRDYLSKNTLNEAIDNILNNFGKAYSINFK